MAREIKFRCWDFNSKRMFQPRHMEYVPATGIWVKSENIKVKNGCVINHFKETYPCNELNKEDIKTFAIMQFTGLKDKNGKEIYEGDIIKVINDTTYSVVEWKDFSWNLHQINWNYYTLNQFKSELIEVIGNIYENPELIKGDE